MSTEQEKKNEPAGRSPMVPLIIVAGAIGVLAGGGLLLYRATSATNHITLASQPKGVTVVQAKPVIYRAIQRYVGTIEPWVEAKIGPQLVAAYVDSVLVRPGDLVRRGQVLATLDCRNSSALARQVGMQAKALEETQAAMAKEAARIGSLLDGGFVSPNEVEQKTAESASKQAQLLAVRAQMLGSDLQVADCILRAPFDGEIGNRFVDPGAFIRPGSPIATVVDRRTLRVTAEVPESDFDAVAPLTPVKIHVLAIGDDLSARITRRAPGAASETRTVHIEINIPNPGRRIPAGTTADLLIEGTNQQPALLVPLTAAGVRGDKANLMVVSNHIAHKLQARVIGEREGQLFIDPSLGRGAWVVTEGRAGVAEGDTVNVKKADELPAVEKQHAEVLDPRGAALPAESAPQ